MRKFFVLVGLVWLLLAAILKDLSVEDNSKGQALFQFHYQITYYGPPAHFLKIEKMEFYDDPYTGDFMWEYTVYVDGYRSVGGCREKKVNEDYFCWLNYPVYRNQ